jgi:hypothetical protein
MGFANAIKVAASLARSGYAEEISAKINHLESVLHAEPQLPPSEAQA